MSSVSLRGGGPKKGKNKNKGDTPLAPGPSSESANDPEATQLEVPTAVNNNTPGTPEATGADDAHSHEGLLSLRIPRLARAIADGSQPVGDGSMGHKNGAAQLPRSSPMVRTPATGSAYSPATLSAQSPFETNGLDNIDEYSSVPPASSSTTSYPSQSMRITMAQHMNMTLAQFRKLEQDAHNIDNSLDEINGQFRTVCQALNHETNGLQGIVDYFDRTRDGPLPEAKAAFENQIIILGQRKIRLEGLAGKISRISQLMATSLDNLTNIIDEGEQLEPDHPMTKYEAGHDWAKQLGCESARLGAVCDGISCRFGIVGGRRHSNCFIRTCNYCGRRGDPPSGVRVLGEDEPPEIWAFAVVSHAGPLRESMDATRRLLGQIGAIDTIVAPISRGVVLQEMAHHPEEGKHPARPKPGISGQVQAPESEISEAVCGRKTHAAYFEQDMAYLDLARNGLPISEW